MGGVSAGRPAAFLDRDGTLNVQAPPHDYIRSADGFAWLPGAAEGAARLAGAGYALAVVSNQRGVARGLIEPGALEAIEALIQAGLEPLGARIEAFAYCPHDLDEGCDCRKPAPGMLLDLAATRGYDLSRSWMVGDSATDVQAGQAAGVRTALIGDGAGAAVEPDLHGESLAALSRLIPAP